MVAAGAFGERRELEGMAQAVEVRLPAAVVTENMEARCRLFPWRFEDTDLLGQRRIVIGMASLASC